MQLRPHQEQAIQSMLDNDKGQIIVPTGGGKTLCMIVDAICGAIGEYFALAASRAGAQLRMISY